MTDVDISDDTDISVVNSISGSVKTKMRVRLPLGTVRSPYPRVGGTWLDPGPGLEFQHYYEDEAMHCISFIVLYSISLYYSTKRLLKRGFAHFIM